MRPAVLFDSVLHVAMLWVLLLAFFFLYASKVESSAFRQQFAGVIRQVLGGVSLRQMLAGTRTSAPYLASAEVALEQSFSGADPAVTATNVGVRAVGVTVAVGLLAVLVAIAVTNPGLAIGSMFRQNAATIACVAVIEYAFFATVISRFVPAPPSTLVRSAVAAL